MPGIDDFKKGFFDKLAILDRVETARRKVLSRFGAFVRQRARTSIRSRKKASSPGSPPHSHVGTLKKLILFAFDQGTQSVVVGPALFARSKILGGQTIPETLEYGGSVATTEYLLSKGRWVGAGSPLVRGTAEGRTSRSRIARVGARPFMRPAEVAERPKFAALWHNSVSK